MTEYETLDSDSIDLGRSSINIPDFEKSISPNDPEDQVYELETMTQSGTFKTSKGIEYIYTDRSETFVRRKLS